MSFFLKREFSLKNSSNSPYFQHTLQNPSGKAYCNNVKVWFLEVKSQNFKVKIDSRHEIATVSILRNKKRWYADL
jgi:hypothetical protein